MNERGPLHGVKLQARVRRRAAASPTTPAAAPAGAASPQQIHSQPPPAASSAAPAAAAATSSSGPTSMDTSSDSKRGQPFAFLCVLESGVNVLVDKVSSALALRRSLKAAAAGAATDPLATRTVGRRSDRAPIAVTHSLASFLQNSSTLRSQLKPRLATSTGDPQPASTPSRRTPLRANSSLSTGRTLSRSEQCLFVAGSLALVLSQIGLAARVLAGVCCLALIYLAVFCSRMRTCCAIHICGRS